MVEESERSRLDRQIRAVMAPPGGLRRLREVFTTGLGAASPAPA